MSSPVFYGTVTYLVTEPVTDRIFNIPFDYLSKGHIYGFVGTEFVSMASTPGQPNRFEFVTVGQLRYNGTLPTNTRVWIRRFTRKDERLANYSDGSVLVSDDLNLVTKQLLFIIQELLDWLEGGREGLPPPGGPSGGNPGDGNLPPSTIQEIIDELLASQLFRDLIELIELVDINAETTLWNTLSVHESWTVDREIRGIASRLGDDLNDIDARFTHEINEIIDANSATVTELTALQTRMGAAESDLVFVNTAMSDLDSSMTSQFALAAARFATNEASIINIQTTYASLEYVEAYTIAELEAAFAPEALDGRLNATSVIQGIRARADEESAGVESIASYVAGSGAGRNPDGSISWPVSPTGLAGALATAQTTISLHTTQLVAEASWRNALATRFAPGMAGSPPALVSAIESAWRTYSDVESTTAVAVQTLQSSRQPIFFRTSAPNPYGDAEFVGTPYRTLGFPTGTLWYQRGGTSLRPFWWNASLTSPPVPAPDEYYGPYAGKPGMWVPNRDNDLENVMGARVDNVVYTEAFEDRVRAEVETKLIAVFDAADFSAVTAISERLVSMVDAEEGFMYSSWNVRINQYAGSANPVIAGVGLGMQTDLTNPEGSSVSSFIVMADRFGVIRPPDIGDDPLTGAVNLADVEVPFVIDSVSGRVMINGVLVARALRLLDGYVGRLTFTELNSLTLEPINPSGMRLVLPSGTSGFNASNTASPFPGGASPQKFLMWAGGGTMNHNNAVFYVDTDGNAVFTGQVQADNISGGMNDAVGIYEVFSTVTASGTSVAWLPGTPELPAATSNKPRKVTAIINVHMFGSGQKAGHAHLQMRRDTASGWTGWTDVADAPVAIPIGTTVNLVGNLSVATQYAVQIRVGISREDDGSGFQYPSSNTYSGVLIAVR